MKKKTRSHKKEPAVRPVHEPLPLSTGLYQEAMDRTFVAKDSFWTYIYEHPAVSQSKKLKQLADKAYNELNALYVAIASEGNLFLAAQQLNQHPY